MPKSTLLLSVSRRYAAISPKSASSGAWGTAFASKAVAAIGAICVEIWERRRLEEEWEDEAAGEAEEAEMKARDGLAVPGILLQVEQTTRCTLRFTAYSGCGQRPAHTLGPANVSYNTTGQEERGAEEPLETKRCRARGLGCILSTRPGCFT